MTRQWHVIVDGASVPVCGFRQKRDGREHAIKHFLDPEEGWEMVCAEPPTPRDFSEQLQTANGAVVTRELLDAVSSRYQELVEQHSGTTSRTAIYVYRPSSGPPHRRQWGTPYRSVAIVTASGIFASFFAADVSDLRTALRRRPRQRKPPFTNQDYRDSAINYLNNKLAESALHSEGV